MLMDVPVGGVQEKSNATLLETQLEAHLMSPMLEERVPLGECTNTMRGGSQEEVQILKNAPKGQWKRLARMQGQRNTNNVVQIGEKLEELARKRGRDVTDASKEEISINIPAKKGTTRKVRKTLNNIEMEKPA